MAGSTASHYEACWTALHLAVEKNLQATILLLLGAGDEYCSDDQIHDIIYKGDTTKWFASTIFKFNYSVGRLMEYSRSSIYLASLYVVMISFPKKRNSCMKRKVCCFGGG